MPLYFLVHERSTGIGANGRSRIGLLLGVIFGVAQQRRDAHFVSHDRWSAFPGWMIPLTQYALASGAHLYARSPACALDGSRAQESFLQAHKQQKPRRKLRNSSPEHLLETCSTTYVRKV